MRAGHREVPCSIVHASSECGARCQRVTGVPAGYSAHLGDDVLSSELSAYVVRRIPEASGGDGAP